MIGDIIFDIDGTIADPSHRLWPIQNGPKNWAAFQEMIPDDTPIMPVIAMYKAIATMRELSHWNSKILISTARNEASRAATEKWLADQRIGYDRMFMRKHDDYREDSIVKQEMLAFMRAEGYDPRVVFDDRASVVRMWRRNGLFVFDVRQTEEEY